MVFPREVIGTQDVVVPQVVVSAGSPGTLLSESMLRIVLIVVNWVDVRNIFEEVFHVPIGQVPLFELSDWSLFCFPLRP